jgi:hypothetical protein
LKTSNRTAPIRADRAVVPAHSESLSRDIGKGISIVPAEFEHSAVEAEIGIDGGSIKVKIMAEREFATDQKLGRKYTGRVQAFVAHNGRVINERGIRR